MRHTIPILLALLLVFGLTGCAANQASEDIPPSPAATPEPTPTPQPTPVPFDPEAGAALLKELWLEAAAARLDLAPILPSEFLSPEETWDIRGSDPEERAWLPRLEAAVAEQLDLALSDAINSFNMEAAYGPAGVEPIWPDWNVSSSATWPEWQYIYTLTRGCGSVENAVSLICGAIDLAALPNSDGSTGLTVTLSPLHYQEALKLPGGDVLAHMGRHFSYSYTKTVFGEQAEELEYVQPPAEGSLADGIVWPLSSHTRLRKTWYADRDGGARKHTGTDIWAKADTEIYSCTDGTVTFVGYSAGMGNAVVVTDQYGYEFHYYHMIRLPDFISQGQQVTAGQLIGHVGNTGNSSLDHLHLTIVAPDGTYVNPYPYLAEVEP